MPDPVARTRPIPTLWSRCMHDHDADDRHHYVPQEKLAKSDPGETAATVTQFEYFF